MNKDYAHSMQDDTISRQAAIDMCRKPHMRNADCSDFEMEIMMLPSAQPEVTEEAVKDFCRKRCLTILTNDCFHKLTSAHIEPLTENEKRIFLSAMRREEKMCKQINEEYEGSEGPYEVDLVKICHEITRKVKGALWTI